MALLTAAELKASREAVDAEVNTVSDAEADAAIAEATAEVYELLGYRIETAATSVTVRGQGSAYLSLTERAQTVSAVTEDGSAVTAATYHLSGDGWVLIREEGIWTGETIVVTGTFGFPVTDDKRVLAKKAVRLLAVRYLQSSSSADNLPSAPPGGVMTSFSSENTSFTFFTPESGRSGYPDVDRIIDLIGPRVQGSRKRLVSLPLVGSSGYPSELHTVVDEL